MIICFLLTMSIQFIQAMEIEKGFTVSPEKVTLLYRYPEIAKKYNKDPRFNKYYEACPNDILPVTYFCQSNRSDKNTNPYLTLLPLDLQLKILQICSLLKDPFPYVYCGRLSEKMAEEIKNPIFHFKAFSIQNKKQSDPLCYEVSFKPKFFINELDANAKKVLATLKKNNIIHQDIDYCKIFLEEHNQENTNPNTILLRFLPNIKTLTHPINITPLITHKKNCHEQQPIKNLTINNNKIFSPDYVISSYFILDDKTLIVEYKSGSNTSAVTNKLLHINHRVEIFKYSNTGDFEKKQTIYLCSVKFFFNNPFLTSMKPTVNKKFNLLTVYKGCIIIHDPISKNYYCFSKPNNKNIEYQYFNK